MLLGCGECIPFYQYGFSVEQAYRPFWSFLHLSCFPEDLQIRSYGKGPVQAAKCSREPGMATNRTRVGDEAHSPPRPRVASVCRKFFIAGIPHPVPGDKEHSPRCSASGSFAIEICPHKQRHCSPETTPRLRVLKDA